MENDKVFNLQLTIQKLQEEVSLYRNGADGEEIFQLIAEKESEIKVLKASIVNKNENLRKLAKKSAEVLARCDRVQSEYETLQFEHSDLIQEKKTLLAAVEELKSLNYVVANKCEQKSVAIIQLEQELATREESIEKLQSRCAALISQKNDKLRECEKESRDVAADRAEKNSNIKELSTELERALLINTELKESMNREHANNLDLSSQLNEARSNLLAATKVTEELELSGTTLKAEIASILKDKADLQVDLHDARKSHSLAASTASVNDSQMRNLLEGKDTEIIELKQNIRLSMEISLANEKSLKEESRAAALLIKADADLISLRLSKMEAERDVNASYQKDIVTLKMKNADLEEKIKRQDQYMKSRLLKDKSNINSTSLYAPEPSEPSYRPPSARAIAIAATAASMTGPTTEVRASGPSVKSMR